MTARPKMKAAPVPGGGMWDPPSATATPGEFRIVPRAEVYESPQNPRRTFDPAALEELAASIRASGVHVPLLVRPNPNGAGQYEIGAGHRRFRAAALAGLAELPVIIRPMNDVAFLELLVLENDMRVDVHPLEEARGYEQLMKAAGYDVAKIADRVGRSFSYVYDRLHLLKLIKPAQQLFLAGRFTTAHAVQLARLPREIQEKVLDPEDQNYYGSGTSPLWREEGGHSLFDEADEAVREQDPYFALIAKSVAELKAWIDDHVRFDPAGADPVLFPETVQAVQQAREAELKVVKITHDHQLRPDARDEHERTYGPMSWRKAEPPCDYQVLGIVVAGPERGASFPACIQKKKCTVHWKQEQRQAKRRATASGTNADGSWKDSYEAQRAKQEAERARFRKAAKPIRAALEARVAELAVKPGGPVAQLVVKAALPWGTKAPTAATLEELLRQVALLRIRETLKRDYSCATEWPALGKAFGVDVGKIVDEVSPPEKPAPKGRPVKKAAKGPKAR